MRRGVRLHPAAEDELVEAVRWYDEIGPALAQSFLERVGDAIDHVQRRPRSCRPYVRGTRRMLVRGFPYLVVYREQGDTIEVLAVAHASRKPGYWRARLSP